MVTQFLPGALRSVEPSSYLVRFKKLPKPHQE